MGAIEPVTLDALIDQAYKAKGKKALRARRVKQVRYVSRSARHGAHRWRYQLAPLAVIAAVAATGWLVRLTPRPVGTALIVAVVVGGISWWLHRRLDRPVERMYARIYVGFFLAWLLLLARVGWHVEVAGKHPMTAVLVAGGVLLAVPWWRHYRIRPVQPEPVPDTTLAEEWERYVSPAGQPLPGSKVILPVMQVGTRLEFDAVLARGKQTIVGAVAATDQIEGALELPTGSLVIEPSPSMIANRIKVTLITAANPLHKTVFWPGPHLFDPRTGTAPAAMYVDSEPVLYRFYRTGSGPMHDLISGSTDSGKSRVLDLLLAYERHSGIMASLVIDPQNGQSVPEWKRNVGAFAAGTTEGLALLRQVYAEMLARNLLLSDVEWVDPDGRKRRGVDHFDPNHPAVVKLGLKLWCLTIDEAHLLLKIKAAANLVADIVAASRKCGIKVRLVTQVPLLSSLGGKMEIRDAVAAGNVICLRTANALSGQVAFNGALPIKPNRLPREWPDGSSTAGVGFSLGASSRPAMMRMMLPKDPHHWANTGRTTPVVWLPTSREPAPASTAVSVVKKPAVVEVPQDGTCRDAVLVAMREGKRQRSEMVAATGYDLSSVDKALNALVKAGTVSRLARGQYELV